MEIDKYMSNALQTAAYPDVGNNLLYPTIGLTGEAGEVANNIKKLMRDHGLKQGMNLAEFYSKASPKARKLIDETSEELGDVLWYVALMCYELGISMQSIAKGNNNKLERRYSNTKYAV